MGGRQANQDNRQADGRGDNPPKAPPEKTGGKPVAPAKPKRS
jgi:hypothetical protein